MWLLFLPFYHTYGLHVACFRQFYTPYTYVVVPRWNTTTVLKAIPKCAAPSSRSRAHTHRSFRRYGVNVMPLIPSAIHQMVNSPLFSKTDLSTLVSVSSGAAYLPPELSSKFMRVVKNAATMLEGPPLPWVCMLRMLTAALYRIWHVRAGKASCVCKAESGV